MKDKFKLFKNKSFLRFTIAGFISALGNSARTVAVPLVVFLTTKSYTMSMLSAILMAIPPILMNPIAGKVADKYNKKYIMASMDVIRCILDILLIFSMKNAYLVIFINFFMSAANVFFTPAAKAMTPYIVKKEDLNDANSINNFLGYLCSSLGPICGGIFMFKIAILFDAFTFIVSSISIMLIKYETEDISKGNAAKVQKLGIKEFINLLKDNGQLGIVVCMTFILSLAFPMIVVIMPGYSSSILSNTGKTYGFILSIMSIGGLIGAVINSSINKKFKEEKVFLVAYTVYGLIYAPLFFCTSQYLVLTLFFIQGITMPIAGIASVTLEQKMIDKSIMGRFFGIVGSIQAILGLLARFASGIIAQYTGCLNVFLVAFLLMGIGSMFGVVRVKHINEVSLSN